MIVNDGLESIVGLICSDQAASYSAFDYVAIGTDNTAAAATQTGLQAQDSIAAATGTVDTTTPDAPFAQWVKTGFTFAGTKTIYEFGVFDGSTGTGTDTLLCRSVGSGISVTSDDTLDVTIKVTASDGS
jgi:hypothetical protein